MSEVVEQRTSNGDGASTKTSSTQNTRLKQLTSGSSWVSPFRDSGSAQKNLRKQLKEDNSIKNIHVPSKFTTHPTLEAQKKEKKDKEKAAKLEKKKAKAAEEAKDKGDDKKDAKAALSQDADASTRSLKDEPIDTPKENVVEDEGNEVAKDEVKEEEEEEEEEVKGDNESERPLSEAEQAETEEIKAEDTEELQDKAEDAEGEVSGDKDATKSHEGNDTEGVDGVTDIKDAGDDNIKELVKEEPIEIVTQPGAKYEPVPLPNQETLDQLKDKPKLLHRYQELNAVAIGSMSRSLDDPSKVVELGSGMRITQQQLLDIAAKRVAPVLANINDEVSKTRSEDDIKRQKELDSKVASHEKKLQKDFEKHNKKIEKQKSKFTLDIGKKLEDLKNKMKNADLTAANFEKSTKQEIEQANDDFKERETTAIEKHSNDKETIIKNHEELERTKKQELEDAKTTQEKTTQEIEELHEKKTELDNANSELSTKIEELTAELNEKTIELDDLKAKHAEKESGISKNQASKEELDDKISSAKKELETKQKQHGKLSAEVGVLGGILAAYTAKLGNLKSENASHGNKLTDAKKKYQDWEQEKDQLATDIAREHERKRINAQEEAETKRVEDELEQKRLEKENERLEAERKVAEKKEEERKLKEEHDKAEAERLANDPEHQFMLARKQREADEKQLDQEKAEKERIYSEHKDKEAQEALTLQQEIEELKAQKAEKVEAAREEKEKLAQVKLEQIEQLKTEHEERLKLFREKVEFEELQKTRLMEEVDNLNKIKNLREEKARLTNELQQGVEFDDVNKLIEERELEVARLTKQIELDNTDLRNAKFDESKVSQNTPAPTSSSKSTDVQSKEVNATKSPKENAGLFTGLGSSSKDAKVNDKSGSSKSAKDETKSSSKKSEAIATGVGALGVAGATGAAASAALDAKHAARNVPVPSDTKSTGGFGRLKSLTKKLSRGNSTSEGSSGEPVATNKEKTGHVAKSAPVNISKQPGGKTATTKNVPAAIASKNNDNSRSNYSDSSSAYETYSVYEEVSEAEFQKNLGNPDYMEMTAEEFEKHRQAV